VCLYKAVSKLSENAGLFSAVTYDAGLLTYVVAQHYHPVHQQQYISSGSFGAMGMAVPYAIGASLGNGIHSKPVLCITGDGSFMMSLSELATLKSSPSSVILIVFNNNGYRSIRITHEKFFDGRIMGTDKSNGLFLPKIKKIASAMDIEYTLIKNISDLDKLFKKISTIKRPKLVIEIQSYNDQLVEPSVISKLNEMGKFETPEISEMYPPIDY
jgi:acetolactate synthase-1/2/3 large subunit